MSTEPPASSTSDAETGAAAEPDTETDAEAEPRYGRRRRAPRYGSFTVSGAVVGVAFGILLTLSRATSGEFSLNTTLSYVAAIFGLIGAVLGAGLAVVLDRRSSRPR